MRFLIFIFSLSTLTACAVAPWKLNQLHPGMEKEDVIKELGNPVGVTQGDGKELLEYDVDQGYPTRYWFIFSDNKLERFAPASAFSANPGQAAYEERRTQQQNYQNAANSLQRSAEFFQNMNRFPAGSSNLQKHCQSVPNNFGGYDTLCW